MRFREIFICTLFATVMTLNWRPNWQDPEVARLLPKSPDPPPDTSLEDFIEKSANFFRPFPIDTNRCMVLKSKVSKAILEENINSVYPILHENVLFLCAQYLLFKRNNGTNKERELYENMDLLQFLDRLLNKRAIYFYGRHDTSLYPPNVKGNKHLFENVGTNAEKNPLTLKNCLCYDEIKLSALIGVSSLTYFLNDGNRKNMGQPAVNRSDVEDRGIIIGLVGARLVKPLRMEYQEILISQEQNQNNNGYDTLFFEANERAQKKNTTAYIHVVGLGLGVWKKAGFQNKLFMDACAQRIQILGPHLHNVSDIRFSWIAHNFCGTYKDGDLIPISGHPKKGIKIYINKKNPHEKLTGSDAGKLLVVSYAWDGNALPGNEYWNNKLGSTGDSAAASSTQISEIHNVFINPKVSARNARIVTEDRILPLRKFVEKITVCKKRPHEEN